MHRDVTGGVLGGQLGDEGAGKVVTVGCLGGAEPQQQIPLPHPPFLLREAPGSCTGHCVCKSKER